MKNRIVGWIGIGTAGITMVLWMGCASNARQPELEDAGAARAKITSVVTFLEQPQGFTNQVGASGRLQVSVADGKNFQYQWLRNGSPLLGSNRPVLPRDKFQAADGGSYSVMVFRPDGAGDISEVAKVRAILPTLGLGNAFNQRAKSRDPSGLFHENNEKANAERGEPNHAEQAPAKSIWLQWTAPAGRGVATFDTEGSGFDTRLAVYELRRNATTPDEQLRITDLDPEAVTYDDDRGADLTSLAYFNTQPGQRYFIAVDGKAASSAIPPAGNLVLRWQWKPSDPLPVIKKQPQDDSIESRMEGRQDAKFSVTMQERGDYEFRWYRTGEEKVLFTEQSDRTSTFFLRKVTEAEVGSYFAEIINRKFKSPPVRTRMVMMALTSSSPAATGGNFGSCTVSLIGSTPFGYTCSGGTFDRYVRVPKLYTGPTNGNSSAVFNNPDKKRVLIATTNCLNAGIDTALQFSLVRVPFTVLCCSNNYPPATCSAATPSPTNLTVLRSGMGSNTHYNALIFYRSATISGQTNIRMNWRYQ
jgi:hypothetical protein